MTLLWVVYGVVLLTGLGAATAASVADLRRRPVAARRALTGHSLDADVTALLTGGPARAVDAELVRLVAQGRVRADGGRLAVAPEQAAEADAADRHLLDAVAAAGQTGLDAVRRRAVRPRLHRQLMDLADRDLIMTPSGRFWAPARVVAPTLAGVLGCVVGMAVVGPWSSGQAGAVAVLVLLPSAFLPGLVWRLRAGHRGPDPRTALGRDISDLLRAELPTGATEAERVAAGGFAAMTDAELRRAIQGRAPDSRWQIPPAARRGTPVGSNELLAAEAGLAGGPDDDNDGDGDGPDYE